MRRWLVVVLTSTIVSLVVSGSNTYYALQPDKAWCARYHLICRWGGGWELDPEWHSEQARIERLQRSIAKAFPPRESRGPLDRNDEVSGYPQDRVK